jgi:hypothetical protein
VVVAAGNRRAWQVAAVHEVHGVDIEVREALPLTHFSSKLQAIIQGKHGEREILCVSVVRSVVHYTPQIIDRVPVVVVATDFVVKRMNGLSDILVEDRDELVAVVAGVFVIESDRVAYLVSDSPDAPAALQRE